MKLEEIGFYTLSDARAQNVSATSPMQRCEMIITGICNFKCPYCRGPREDARNNMPLEQAITNINFWADDGLRNIRFSGGEPTMHPNLDAMIAHAKTRGIERIAISTNGSMSTRLYDRLIDAGANDFSISLDACCADGGDEMAGVSGSFQRIVDNIKHISLRTYVTVGIVITEENVSDVSRIVKFAHDLGVDDIRVISAAQYNTLLVGVSDIEPEILNAHPILKYRVNNIRAGRNVRGLSDSSAKTCWLIQDDSVIVGENHYPCVIHMRERGEPIGKVGPHMRTDRINWMQNHNPQEDTLCKKNCLDVCEMYLNKVQSFMDCKGKKCD